MFNELHVVHKSLISKKSKKGVDMGVKVRYNGGSLSKSVFPTSTKRNGKRGRCFEVVNGTSEYS